MQDNTTTRQVTVTNPQGLHARPAELFVRLAKEFDATIEVINDNQRADAKSILHVLTLGAQKGHQLVLEAVGRDAQKALDALVELVENDFDTDDNTSLTENQSS